MKVEIERMEYKATPYYHITVEIGNETKIISTESLHEATMIMQKAFIQNEADPVPDGHWRRD